MKIPRTLAYSWGTAVVAVVCYATASRVPWLSESYWAPLAAVVVLYPDDRATWQAGGQRFLGTLIGSVVGGLCAHYWHGHLVAYGAGVMVAVGLCLLLRVEQAARICAVTVTTITLIPRDLPAYVVALHRFLEVSFGMLCAVSYATLFERLSPRSGGTDGPPTTT